MPSGGQHPRGSSYAADGLYLGVVLMLGCGLLGSMSVLLWRQHRPVGHQTTGSLPRPMGYYSAIVPASEGIHERYMGSGNGGGRIDGAVERDSTDGGEGVFEATSTAADAAAVADADTATGAYLLPGGEFQDWKGVYGNEGVMDVRSRNAQASIARYSETRYQDQEQEQSGTNEPHGPRNYSQRQYSAHHPHPHHHLQQQEVLKLDADLSDASKSGCDPAGPNADPGRYGGMRIPQFLHQNYLGGADQLDRDSRGVRTHFRREWRLSCQTHNPGWRYKLWDREAAVELLKTRYPWFLSTWLNYRSIVMQSDAIRPFILHAFGGLYLDLDTECYRPVETTLQCWDLVLMAEEPGLANNAQMASVAGHPLWLTVMAALERNAAAGLSDPLYATGPWVITTAFRELANLSGDQPLPGRYRLPPLPEPAASTTTATSITTTATSTTTTATSTTTTATSTTNTSVASTAVVYGPRQWFNPCSWNDEDCHRVVSWATPLLRLDPGKAVEAAEQLLAGGDGAGGGSGSGGVGSGLGGRGGGGGGSANGNKDGGWDGVGDAPSVDEQPVVLVKTTSSVTNQQGAATRTTTVAASSAGLELLRQMNVVGVHHFSGSWLGYDGSKAERSREWVTEGLLSFFTRPEVFVELPGATRQGREGKKSVGAGQQGLLQGAAVVLNRSPATEQHQRQQQPQKQPQPSGQAGGSERTTARSAAAAACFAKHWLSSSSRLRSRFVVPDSSGSTGSAGSMGTQREMGRSRLAAVGAGVGRDGGSDSGGAGEVDGGGGGGNNSTSSSKVGKGSGSNERSKDKGRDAARLISRSSNSDNYRGRGRAVGNEGYDAASPLVPNAPPAADLYDKISGGHDGGGVARPTSCTVISVRSLSQRPLNLGLERALVRRLGCEVHVVAVLSSHVTTAHAHASYDGNSTPTTTTAAAATAAGNLTTRMVQELNVGAPASSPSAGRLFLHSPPPSQPLLLPDAKKDAADSTVTAPVTTVIANTVQDILTTQRRGGNGHLDLVVLNCGSCAWDILDDMYDTGSRILDRVDALLLLHLPPLPYSRRAVLYETYELLYQMHGFLGYAHYRRTKGHAVSYEGTQSTSDEGANTTGEGANMTLLPGGLTLGWLKRGGNGVTGISACCVGYFG